MMMSSAPLLLFYSLLLLFILVEQTHGTVFDEETEQCKAESGYGRKTFVCDVHGRLATTTRKKLTDILAGLKDRIGCECADGCTRADGTDAFIGLLHVTSSKNTDDLKRDMEKEYKEAQLGNTTCEHGLVMVYLKDTQQLATFRGGDSFVLLGDDDMQKLHKLAAQQGSESDTLAVQYLLANYKQVSEAPIDNWYASWLPVIGLIVAVLLVLCLVSILLSMLCAKCLCCCRKNKKEKYEVTKPATYKSIEPLYVITPPSTMNPRHHDAIYSTPYSGSPLPFPPPPGTTVPHTPNSTYRYRVDTNKKAPKDYENGSMGQLPIDEPRIVHPIYSPLPALDPTYGTIPRARLNGAPPLSPTYSSGNDPHFLDPRRKQETQTREELIY